MGRLNQDVQQYLLSWNGQHQNCSLEVDMGRLKQDVQQYCLGTVNNKTVHWRWRWEALTRMSNLALSTDTVPAIHMLT